jgi:hypothetical protein
VLTLAGYEATTTLTDLATVDYRGAIRAQFPDPIAMRILAHIRAVLEVEAALVGDHEKEVEEWKRTGYDIFGALGRVPGQSVNESAVIEAIRKLLQEYDSQRDSDAE